MRWVSLRLEALTDIEEAQDYFAAGGPSFKDKFTNELEETIELIQQFPEAFPKVLGEIRRVLFRKHTYAVYYIAWPEHLEVIAVIHTRRDPEIWKKRV